MDTTQLDFFQPAAPRQMRARITADNVLILSPPDENPRGIEAAEQRAAMLRDIENRKQTGWKPW